MAKYTFALLFVFGLIELNQAQLLAINPNPAFQPVGCPNWGLCADNNYEEGLAYYQCMEGSCVCNNGTYNSTVVQIPAVSSTLGTNYQACAIANNPCTSKPCPANSNCIRSNVNYRCTCWANFTGASCNISLPTGVCASSPCQNGATCDDNGDGTFNCTCAANYMGELCENFNYCSNNNQCWNGGKCLLLFSGEDFYCNCTSAWQGKQCGTATLIPADTSAGCWATSTTNSQGLNDANCTTTSSISFPTPWGCRSLFQQQVINDASLAYYCVGGSTCNVCDTNPFSWTALDLTSLNSNCKMQCSNSASKQNNTYNGWNQTCGCSSSSVCGSSGKVANCYKYKDNIDPFVCNSTICANGGYCVEESGTGYSCTCPREFADGAQCKTPKGPCSSTPCQHSGQCLNATQGWDYTCNCTASYTGTNCETKIPCVPNPCKYGGMCTNSDDLKSFTCTCLSLYYGTTCTNLDLCYTNPCQNGNCSTNQNFFNSTWSCDCNLGWTGVKCGTMIDYCESTPCFYQGTCVNNRPPDASRPLYNCTCQAGTLGDNCETNPDDCKYVTGKDGKQHSTCNLTDSAAICIDGFNSFVCECGPDYTAADCSIPMIVWNATILIFGPDVAVSSDIINLLTDLLSNPTNIKDMVPFILGLETEEQRMSMSWDYSDMFSWASYEEKTLQLERDLYKWNDVTLGNCFTFNHRNNTDAQYLGRMTGIMGGFLASLKINSNEYCPWVDTMGIQVFVHPAEEDIFSESVSTMCQPGGQTDIYPFMTAYTRLGGQYGTCIKEASQVKQYFYTGAYATDGCLQSCYQQACENICGCMDPRYPMSQTASACGLTQRNCVDEVTTNLGDPSSWDNCTCPNACSEREYDVSWSRTIFNQRQIQCNQTGIATNNCTADWEDTVRVSIIMKDFSFQLFAETPAESLNSFIGNLGGLLGVLMGVSMITFIEVGFLFIALFAVLCSRSEPK